MIVNERNPVHVRSMTARRRLITGICLALIGSAADAAVSDDFANTYRLEAHFEPSTGDLAVSGTLDVVADRPSTELRLLLNDALHVRSFTHEGTPAHLEPTFNLNSKMVPGAQAIVVPFRSTLQKGDKARLTFRYDGQLTTDRIRVGRGVVSPAWSELTLEAFWYPILLDEPLLRSELILNLPPEYRVLGPGKVKRIAPGRWLLDPQVVVSGRITFAASRQWHVEEQRLSGKLVAALYTAVPEPRSREILGAVAGAYRFYSDLFGPAQSPKTRITLLLANANVGLKYPNQAFATAGDFIVMSKGDPQGQLDTLHHEVAHLWWSAGRPGTADEFLSESVSEYLATRYGGERWGAEWLIKRRAGMAARSAEIDGSILELDGLGSGPRQPLLYDRGPTALWLLHDRVGASAMDSLLTAVHRSRVTRLADFLDVLARRHGSETEKWFRDRL